MESLRAHSERLLARSLTILERRTLRDRLFRITEEEHRALRILRDIYLATVEEYESKLPQQPAPELSFRGVAPAVIDRLWKTAKRPTG